MAFCVSGQGRIFRAFCAGAAERGIIPAGLIVERHASADLEDYGAGAGIQVARLSGHAESMAGELSQALTRFRPDLVCLTFDRLIPATVLASHRIPILNLHMGLLPGTEGLHPLRRTLNSGALFGGATLHVADSGVDRGPIVAQCVVAIRPDDTEASLGARIYPHARDMMLGVIDAFASGRLSIDAQRPIIAGVDYGSLPLNPALGDISLPD